MVRGPSKFKQRDVTRAAKGLEAAGLTIHRTEFDPATERFNFFTVKDGKECELTENEWEKYVREETVKKKT
jgi:hypothetical protein